MPKKISHKQKSRKHSGRRTKKYTRKQKGGSGSFSRKGRRAILSGTSNSMLRRKAKSRANALESRQMTSESNNNEDPLPPVPSGRHPAVASGSLYNSFNTTPRVANEDVYENMSGARLPPVQEPIAGNSIYVPHAPAFRTSGIYGNYDIIIDSINAQIANLEKSIEKNNKFLKNAKQYINNTKGRGVSEHIEKRKQELEENIARDKDNLKKLTLELNHMLPRVKAAVSSGKQSLYGNLHSTNAPNAPNASTV